MEFKEITGRFIMDKILVTGGAGYIGSVISKTLLERGYAVKVIDALWFRKDVPLLYKDNPRYEFIKGDISKSDVVENVLDDVHFIVHAAAVVGDPASKKYPELTYKVNYESSVKLINKARNAGLKGFIFLSTCSNYGVVDGLAKEEFPLKPLSLYAETKVDVEKYLLEMAHNMDNVICRLSTVYGVSPRMRFDLTVNDFTMNAFTKKYLDIFLPYTHRPYIHVSDVACVIAEIIGHFDKVKNNIFNVGFTEENYQKIQIAKIVKKFIPDVDMKVTEKGSDLRDYQVDFSKLHRFLGIENNYTIEKGIDEILNLLVSGKITDPTDRVYYNTFPDLGAEN